MELAGRSAHATAAADGRWQASLPALPAGGPHTMTVRDSDDHYLDRVPRERAVRHVDLIHRARRGDAAAAGELNRRTEALGQSILRRFAGRAPAHDLPGVEHEGQDQGGQATGRH